MKSIEQLVEKIKVNDQIINTKNSELINEKIKEVNNILNLSFKYLTFSNIANFEISNFNSKYGNLIFFQNLCNHAILLDTLIDVNKIFDNNSTDSINKYELWLLWNKEFCVTRLKDITSINTDKEPITRQVIDYGKCAFAVNDGKLIWNMNNITNSIEDNLKATLANKENIRHSIELELNASTIKNKSQF
ncbi:hypothetical protein SAMN02745163_03192 [Clostridium cavendishii DSM 21758]|uniref:Uncharacterized protein n=1 Tax=Clostridium cavendishii DSM 21758 TaxID=1121302 RepID=A0A1M6PLR8_9CLOT|nr:hypothetical protein [Clostridium cavendishii]SHK08787.1 hypothetical protein SAMN02745163_03192 [Clostridium cavendishii DSM 21758]